MVNKLFIQSSWQHDRKSSSRTEKLDIYSLSYNNFIILDDFNIEVEEQQIKAFYDNYGLNSLIRQPTSTKVQVIRLALT